MRSHFVGGSNNLGSRVSRLDCLDNVTDSPASILPFVWFDEMRNTGYEPLSTLLASPSIPPTNP